MEILIALGAYALLSLAVAAIAFHYDQTLIAFIGFLLGWPLIVLFLGFLLLLSLAYRVGGRKI